MFKKNISYQFNNFYKIEPKNKFKKILVKISPRPGIEPGSPA